MSDLVNAPMVAFGAALVAGVWLAVCGLLPRPVRLDDALQVLDGSETSQVRRRSAALVDDPDSRLEQLGARLYNRWRLPLSEETAAQLVLKGRSIGDFFAEKLLLGATGLVLPLLVALLQLGLGEASSPLPVLWSILGAVGGFLLPDLTLRRQGRDTRSDAAEALTAFFDLVTLERLANLSATQSLHAAAALSDAPLFVRIRGALEHARLQQRAPWGDLRELGRDLGLPALGDIADVMALDEQGAALSGALQARVKELRDAQLMDAKIAAQQVSERMTLWMVLPVMVFALIFLAPPLLRLVGLA